MLLISFTRVTKLCTLRTYVRRGTPTPRPFYQRPWWDSDDNLILPRDCQKGGVCPENGGPYHFVTFPVARKISAA